MSIISLENKIAQMLIVGFDGYEINNNHLISKAIKNHNLGGVILFDLEEKDCRLKNIKSPGQVKKLVSDLKGLSDVPLLVGIDYEGGQVARLKEKYGFPKTFSHKYLGDIDDVTLTHKHACEMADTLSGLGINLNFAPVVDLGVNTENPVIAKKERSFSEDPEIVIAHSRQFIKAHAEAGILSCLKHFPGHGSSSTDSHLGFVDITASWQEAELLPYKQLVKEGYVDCVMTAHVYNKNIDPDYPATLSQILISEILRKQIGFEGVVFSDDLHMGAIIENYSFEESLRLAINAGVDILLISYNEKYKDELTANVIDIISGLVVAGEVLEDRINQSYGRITKLKNKLIEGK